MDKNLETRTPWGQKMRNLMEFIKAHTVDLWKTDGQVQFVYQSPNSRFRIVKERQHHETENPEAYDAKGLEWDVWAMLHGRRSYFEDKNIDIHEDDSLVFARQLQETLWQETSYNDRRYIIGVLLEMQKHDDDIREANRGQNGYVPPEPDPVASEEELRTAIPVAQW